MKPIPYSVYDVGYYQESGVSAHTVLLVASGHEIRETLSRALGKPVELAYARLIGYYGR